MSKEKKMWCEVCNKITDHKVSCTHNESTLSPTCSTAELERKADYVFAVLGMVALGAAKKGRYNSGELKEIAEGITERLCR